jgi:hypothetical protein
MCLHVDHGIFEVWIGLVCYAGTEGIDVPGVDKLVLLTQHNGPGTK